MGNLLYIIAVILVIMWLVGYLGLHIASGLIHVLIVLAIIAVLFRIIKGSGV